MSLELLHATRATRSLSLPPLFPRATQWRTAEQLADLRRDRLRDVIASAAMTGYYRAVLHEAGTTDPRRFEPEDLARLPLLDKTTLARHGAPAFMTMPLDGLVKVQTSGSTGSPARFYRTWTEEIAYSRRWMRAYAAYGCRPWDAQVNIAIPDKPDRQGPVKWLRRAGILPRIDKVASDAPPDVVLERVRAAAAPILTGYAGAIESLADYVLASDAALPPPRAVFCTAMEVTERCLAVAERAFRAPAVDVYVTNEFGVIAWSCPVRRGVLHLCDDDLIVEVLDADGRPVPAGTVGELVITSLGLHAMPLIRYRMGDMAARLPGRCECGRGLGLMSRVQGRTAHVIRRPSGAPLTTPLVTSLFGRVDAHDWVRRFQVREEPGGRLRFLISVRQPPTDSQRGNLFRSVEAGIGSDFRVEFEFVDEIPPAPSGKLQYLVPLAAVREPEARRLAS